MKLYSEATSEMEPWQEQPAVPAHLEVREEGLSPSCPPLPSWQLPCIKNGLKKIAPCISPELTIRVFWLNLVIKVKCSPWVLPLFQEQGLGAALPSQLRPRQAPASPISCPLGVGLSCSSPQGQLRGWRGWRAPEGSSEEPVVAPVVRDPVQSALSSARRSRGRSFEHSRLPPDTKGRIPALKSLQAKKLPGCLANKQKAPRPAFRCLSSRGFWASYAKPWEELDKMWPRWLPASPATSLWGGLPKKTKRMGYWWYPSVWQRAGGTLKQSPLVFLSHAAAEGCFSAWSPRNGLGLSCPNSHSSQGCLHEQTYHRLQK